MILKTPVFMGRFVKFKSILPEKIDHSRAQCKLKS